MTRVCLAALWSHWRRNPLQLFTFLAGLALATALWSGVQAINAEARASYDAAAATLGEGQFDQLEPRVGETIPQAAYIALRRAGWQVAPILEGRLRTAAGSVRLIGLDPLTAPGAVNPLNGNAGLSLPDFLSDTIIFATTETAVQLEALQDVRIVIDDTLAPDTAIADVGAAQRLLNQPGQLSRLIIAQTQPLGLPPLAGITPDVQRIPAQISNDPGQLTDSFHLNLTAFGLLSFAVGIFIVHGAIGLAFEQRRAMVRTLRTLGVPLRRLIVLLCAELLILALIAGSIGVALGYLIASILLPDVAATIEGLYGAQVAGSLQLRPAWWLSGMAIAVGGAAVAAIGALVKIARMPILASGRPRAWAVASGTGRLVLGAVSLVLLAVFVTLIFTGGGLLAGFVQLGCLLIGAALALPLLLERALKLGQSRAMDVTAQWFWADTRQQLPGLSLALMALLLAIAANVGVSTMVSSFRLTFVAFLDQRLASDLYVRTADVSQAAELEAFLVRNTDEVMPLLSVETQLADMPAELLGARVGPTYRDNWSFLAAREGAWDEVSAGAAVIVNEQLARRAGLWVGDALTVGETTLPIAGIYGDYGNPIGQAILSEAQFIARYPDQIARQFGVRTDDPAALRTTLAADFGLPEANIINQADIKALSLSIFERTFTVTGALNVLTLAVAAFAILMSLLTLAAIRLPQLAPVWALGMTRAQLGRLELMRAVLLAALTLLFAVPLGLTLAWVLLAVVNVEAFGWRLPLYFFPVDYARLGVLALLAAGLAALWPAIRLIRMPPNALLKVFASER